MELYSSLILGFGYTCTGIGGRLRSGTPVFTEPLLGYHPCVTGFLTCSRDPVRGQCQVGSLTGAVASERGIGGAQRFPQNGWKPFAECKGIRELDCETDGSSR